MGVRISLSGDDVGGIVFAGDGAGVDLFDAVPSLFTPPRDKNDDDDDDDDRDDDP